MFRWLKNRRLLKEANSAYQEGDYSTAFQKYKYLAEDGHIEAQFQIGFMYERGIGIPVDFAEAKRWIEKSGLMQQSDIPTATEMAGDHADRFVGRRRSGGSGS